MRWLKNKIVGAWNYSRIIFINVAYVLAMASSEIFMYLAGFDWDAFFRHEVALVIGFAVNVASVILRLYTFSPVGSTAEDKEALQSVIDSPVITGTAAKTDLDVGNNKPEDKSPVNPTAG